MTDLTDLARPDTVIVYGIDACEDTTRALHHLEAAGTPHHYVRLDQDASARARLNGAGYLATPVLITPAGQVFVEPSDAELDSIVASASAVAITVPASGAPAADAR